MTETQRDQARKVWYVPYWTVFSDRIRSTAEASLLYFLMKENISIPTSWEEINRVRTQAVQTMDKLKQT